MKVSILSQGYAIVPLVMLQDKAISQYNLRAYIAVSSDWAKFGCSRVNIEEMSRVSGWPIKTCQRAISGLSRYALIQDAAGKRVKDIATAEDVYLYPKSSILVKAKKEEGDTDSSDLLRKDESERVRGDSYYSSDSENDKSLKETNVVYNNKNPYIYNTQYSNTEVEKNQDDLSTTLELEHKTLPESMGKTWLSRVVKMYQLLWLSTYGRLPQGLNYGRVGKSLKPLKENFSEYQLALMLIQYFEWYGAGGDDSFIHQKLQQNTFPLSWFPTYVDAISVFLGDTLDDQSEMEALVNNKLSEIS